MDQTLSMVALPCLNHIRFGGRCGFPGTRVLVDNPRGGGDFQFGNHRALHLLCCQRLKANAGSHFHVPLSAPANSLLRQWHCPLTRDLVLQPGEFGLGYVPAKFAPDTTTRVVCGFCSTGCSLDIHLKDGAAVNLSPTSNYPVNLG